MTECIRRKSDLFCRLAHSFLSMQSGWWTKYAAMCFEPLAQTTPLRSLLSCASRSSQPPLCTMQSAVPRIEDPWSLKFIYARTCNSSHRDEGSAPWRRQRQSSTCLRLTSRQRRLWPKQTAPSQRGALPQKQRRKRLPRLARAASRRAAPVERAALPRESSPALPVRRPLQVA